MHDLHTFTLPAGTICKRNGIPFKLQHATQIECHPENFDAILAGFTPSMGGVADALARSAGFQIAPSPSQPNDGDPLPILAGMRDPRPRPGGCTSDASPRPSTSRPSTDKPVASGSRTVLAELPEERERHSQCLFAELSGPSAPISLLSNEGRCVRCTSTIGGPALCHRES